MADASAETGALLERAAAGDVQAWGALMMAHQERLVRMVAFRMDPRLRGRVDAADIVQEGFAEGIAHRLAYFQVAKAPLFLWLRGVVSNKLLEVHRHYLGTRMRDARREVPFDGSANGDATSSALWAQLSAHATRASVAAARREVQSRLAEALDEMGATDREVLALRHFEQLSNGEAAEVLGIEERAAAKRYLRALQRLRKILSDMPGGLTEMRP